MEKELFYILQNIKRDINTLDLVNLKKRLEEIKVECMHEEDNFNYYNKLFFINNIKFLLLKIIMFGRCTKNQKIKYEYLRKNLEKNLDIIEDNYNNLFTESGVLEVLIEVNSLREIVLNNNYKQINDFLKLVGNLSNEEKERILSYKMGVNNG